MTRAFDAITQKYWAMTPDALQKVARIALRHNDKEAWESLKEGLPDAVGKAGAHMSGTSRVSVHGRVAVLPLSGPIFPKANMMTDFSGATSLEMFSRDLNTALDDDGIESIVIDVDSPGGVAYGPSEMADIIVKARAEKPIFAYVSGMACSAAYWIASAAGEIVAHKSAMLGSIGVVVATPVQEQPDMNGDVYFEIVSSHAKNKRPDPRTDEGMAEIVRELDSIEQEFHTAIAENRGVSVNDVIHKFGQGGCFIASEAVAVGMADRLGTFNDLINELNNPEMKGPTMTTTDTPKETATSAAPQAVTVESIQADHPDVAHALGQQGYTKGKAEGLAEGLAEGAQAERSRIAGLDELSRPGCEELVAAAKADGKTTKEELAVQILDKDKSIGSTYLNTVESEAASAPAIAPTAPATGVETGSAAPAADAPIEERAAYDWEHKPEERAGFVSKDDYISWRQGVDAGKIRVKSDLRKQ